MESRRSPGSINPCPFDGGPSVRSYIPLFRNTSSGVYLYIRRRLLAPPAGSLIRRRSLAPDIPVGNIFLSVTAFTYLYQQAAPLSTLVFSKHYQYFAVVISRLLFRGLSTDFYSRTVCLMVRLMVLWSFLSNWSFISLWTN